MSRPVTPEPRLVQISARAVPNARVSGGRRQGVGGQFGVADVAGLDGRGLFGGAAAAPVGPQHVPGDPVQPGPGVLVPAGIETVPPGERAGPDLTEQVVGDLPAGPAGQETVHGDLVPPDHLDERVGPAAGGPLDQRAVGFHPPSFAVLLPCSCAGSAAAFGRRGRGNGGTSPPAGP